MRGALRAAGNVYFPKVESSIYLPRQEGAVSAELHELLRRADVGPVMSVIHTALGPNVTAQQLRNALPMELFTPIPDEEILAGYHDLFGDGEEQPELREERDAELLTGDDEWRHPEFLRIRETPKDDYLSASDPGVHEALRRHISRVRSVDVLRETRALRGFTRVRDDVLKLSAGKALLRRQPLPPEQDWLPAYVVKGEGIYIELEPQRLAAWEARAAVQAHADKITRYYGNVASRTRLARSQPEPTFRSAAHTRTPLGERVSVHLRLQLGIVAGAPLRIRHPGPRDGRLTHLYSRRRFRGNHGWTGPDGSARQPLGGYRLGTQ
ncbi:MAG: hypothetical protein V9F03_07045 [Microthrixaceae bacterium]